MSSLFDIPAQLALVLSLAAGSTAQAPIPPTITSTISQHASPYAPPYEAPEGPLLYSEHSWLRALHDNPHAARQLGMRVFVTSGGRYYLPTPHDRQRVLAARNDPALATPVARAVAEHNAARLRGAFNRAPVTGDLYIAHLFGPETAIDLVRAVGEEPDAPIRACFPALAEAIADASVAAPVTVEDFYLRVLAAFDEPPRLVAIGLRPAAAKRGKERRSMEQTRRLDLVATWRAEVVTLGSPQAAPQ